MNFGNKVIMMGQTDYCHDDNIASLNRFISSHAYVSCRADLVFMLFTLFWGGMTSLFL